MNILLMILVVIAAFLLTVWLFPYPMVKLLVFILRHTVYQVKAIGCENIPKTGPALLFSNHVSPFDNLIIMGATRRKVHLMMHSNFYRHKIFSPLFRRLGILEVPGPAHPKKMQKLLAHTREILSNGGIVCVFPEGGVSENGLIAHFKNGISQMLPEDKKVPVIPIRLGMVWGSMFAIFKDRIRFIAPRQFPVPVDVTIGKPVSPDLSPYAMRQLISEMGADTEKEPYRGEKPIHHFFASRAKWHPFRVTYKDFGAKGSGNFTMLVKALLLSREIRRLDPKYSEYIGVLLPNCSNLTAVLLGVLYADRTPAVLNYTSGSETLNLVMRKAKLRVVLTSRKFLEKLHLEQTSEMILLEDLAPRITRGQKFKTMLHALLLPVPLLLRLYSPLSRNDLQRQVALLFSSGSTGIPKGVMLTHHNINSNIQSFWRNINWTKHDKIVGSLPVFHAYGFTVCFAFPGVSGTQVALVTNPLDASTVCSLVEQEKCTLMMATPTFLQNYMRKYRQGQFDSLRLVITGAEKLRHDISDKFKELTGLAIVEGFGCTELSPIVAINLSKSCFILGRESGKVNSIGAPLPGIHVKIVDPDNWDVELPPDTSGLMLVKGGLVMKGYLDDPEATAKVIRNGFYSTGDIASMSSDGYITITGRLSRFSKIAGEMVPHEMVELSINEILQSETREIAVTGKSDPKRGEKLLVFYSSTTIIPEEIVDHLRAKGLPNLWIPKATDFIKLEKIPLLGSGKVDLQAIKDHAEKIQ